MAAQPPFAQAPFPNWKQAIEYVLQRSGQPMLYTDIAADILRDGLYNTRTATPAQIVHNTIRASISNDGVNSPFSQLAAGTFTFRALPGILPQQVPNIQAFPDEELSSSIIHSFGMYWQRDMVNWTSNNTQIFGKQQATSDPVNFANQLGVYILYDLHTVVYVGRSIDRPLGRRLYEHTTDRLSSRWNRFSWFGLHEVTDDGQLTAINDTHPNISSASMIATFEALLIEALEPPQNRKRGDGFSAIEYIQSIDPTLQAKQAQFIIDEVKKMLGVKQ